MTKKNIVDGQERFDGFAVAVYDGKFAGSFDLEDDMGNELAMDEVVTFVVTARVGGANFDTTKAGDIKRTNKFDITSATALDPTLASNVLNVLSQAPSGNQLTIQGAIAAQEDEDLDDEDRAIQDAINGPTRPAVKVTDPALLKFLGE